MHRRRYPWRSGDTGPPNGRAPRRVGAAARGALSRLGAPGDFLRLGSKESLDSLHDRTVVELCGHVTVGGKPTA